MTFFIISFYVKWWIKSVLTTQRASQRAEGCRPLSAQGTRKSISISKKYAKYYYYSCWFLLQISEIKQCNSESASNLRIIVKFAVKWNVLASICRQYRLLDDCPKRIAQFLLRVTMHPIVCLTSVIFSDLPTKVFHGVLAYPQLLGQFVWSNLDRKRKELRLA